MVLTAAVLVALGACGGRPVTTDPTGVDTLTVPTPSPDPEDFVAAVDHDRWPLAPGSRWEYELLTAQGTGRRVVTVDEPAEVGGLPATPVRTVTVLDGERTTLVRWYAQDRDGHVWLVGEDGRWELGAEVEAAGLWVPAEPRLGDGYLLLDLPGAPAEQVGVRVEETGVGVTVPAGEYDDVVRLRVGPLSTGSDDNNGAGYDLAGGEEHVHLAPGVGEVLRVAGSGRVQARLVSFEPGP